MSELSKSAVNRAGDVLRAWHSRGADLGEFELDAHDSAFSLLSTWRTAHSYPLTKVTNGLRVMADCPASGARVAQRLKRAPQIVNKLVRQPGMKLARMEDIGGCRAVLPSPRAVEAVAQRMRARWPIHRDRDYVAHPKDSGYRAIHFVTERDGKRIEVQLRTVGQQAWADAVEQFATAYELPLKDEVGPDPVLEFFRCAGLGIYCDEYLLDYPTGFKARFDAAQAEVRHWIAQHAEEAKQ
ncbi:RelA/SpoT domain-containing protein [Streptomyces sp. WP-1]|uniref:RelA/SpoT domain-containing protein n=1 Tax=Streptomyces sp. WP-1 TaxID=3041497 RepID=UPI00264796D2|nr:RelA/SpoT domain-containing protein [Streptomyces sp. WP-1]WKE70456.1 RelA/SpoT domain-containing protein [Streptomyces sp. WP-1]